MFQYKHVLCKGVFLFAESDNYTHGLSVGQVPGAGKEGEEMY